MRPLVCVLHKSHHLNKFVVCRLGNVKRTKQVNRITSPQAKPPGHNTLEVFS
jgi:hypothetical protein